MFTSVCVFVPGCVRVCVSQPSPERGPTAAQKHRFAHGRYQTQLQRCWIGPHVKRTELAESLMAVYQHL